MTVRPLPGIDTLQSWIGRTVTAQDEITPRLVQEFNATFGADEALPLPGTPAPVAIHWCLAPPVARAGTLGEDGHPARGGFLPQVPLPRRMWAGGTVSFHHRLLVGDRIERRSRISDVTLKSGRSGPLCFVTVEHEVVSPRGLAITEQQDIVYRAAASGPAAAGIATAAGVLPPERWRREMWADPVMLFRYSALTFNGHRIHYDQPYATAVEHYPGLVVHGPLQATLLIAFAAQLRNAPPAWFSFRALQPLFDFERFSLGADETADGLRLSVSVADGKQTMEARACWQI